MTPKAVSNPQQKKGPSFRSRLEARRQAAATDVTQQIYGDVSSTGHAEPAPEPPSSAAQGETSASDRSARHGRAEIPNVGPARATSPAPTDDSESLKTYLALLPHDQALVRQIWATATHEAAIASAPRPSPAPNLAERIADLLRGIRDVTAQLAAADSFDTELVGLLQCVDGETSYLRLTLRRHLPSEDEDASVAARFLAAIRAAGPKGKLKDKINDLAPKKWRAPQVSCILNRLCDEGKIARLDLKQHGAAERWIATERA